jgi:hypothetical protein
MKVYENTFDISGEKVNVVASYGADQVEVYNNVFFYNSSNGGRIIFPDGGAEYWEIHDNEITITSNTSEAQYGIRVRGIDGRSSNYNLIYNNSIDASGASGPIEVISLGGGSATSHHNSVYNNYLKGNSNIINWYGLSDDGDFYCNKIIHTATDGGYPINLRDNPVENTRFWNNDISTGRSDGKLVYSKMSNSSVVFCSDDISTDDMAGVALSVSSSACGSACDNPTVDGPSSDDGSDISVSAPLNLRVVESQ